MSIQWVLLRRLLFITFVVFCCSDFHTISAQERDRFSVSIYPRQVFLGEIKLKQGETCLAETSQNINSGLAYRVGYLTPKSHLRTSYAIYSWSLGEGVTVSNELLFIDWIYKGFFVGLGSGRGRVKKCFTAAASSVSAATAFNLGYNYNITEFIQIGAGYLQSSFATWPKGNGTLVIKTFFIELSYLF